MKFILRITILLLAISKFSFVNAQGINFQGVARSANGTIISSSNISLRLSIISKNVDATPEYVETKTVVTNPQGIFSVVVGDAANATVIGNFKNIVWSDGIKFLKVEMDPAAGSNFINMGATQLQYVPYSFYSLGVNGANVSGIIPVKSGGTGVNNLNDLKKVLGGVGNVDSIGNIKIGNNVLAKAVAMPSMFNGSLNKNNINIGIGDSALFSNSTGGYNVAIGNKSLAYNRDGGFNTAIGYGTMLEMGNDTSDWQGWANTAVGSTALMKNKYGVGNIAVGSGALELGTLGNFNTAYGMDALHFTNGSFNTGIGDSALSYLNFGNNNTSIGYRSGLALISGNKNIFIGHSAGANSTFSNVSNRLVIENSDTNKPLIYGEFDTDKIVVNGDLNVTGKLSTLNLNPESVFTSFIIDTNNFRFQKTSLGFIKGENDLLEFGQNNIAIGDSSLYLIDSGWNNIAIGPKALIKSRKGSNSVGIGSSVLMFNAGVQNNAIGIDALKLTDTACCNNAFGSFTLTNNKSGHRNSAFGNFTLNQNTTGIMNSGFGRLALNGNKTGSYNSAFGTNALQMDSTGSYNVAVGFSAGANLAQGSNNIYIGANAQASSTTASNETVIGNTSTVIAEIKGALKSNGQILSFKAKTAAYTALTSDEVITGDASNGAFTITLPTAVGATGQTYTIKRMNAGGNDIYVGTTSSQTIDGAANYLLNVQYGFVKVISDGYNWVIIGKN